MPAKRSVFLSATLTVCCLAILAINPGQARSETAPPGNDTLLTIDGKQSTAADFASWWQYWKEKDMPFPESPDPYIDWLLLVREAEMMELYRRPEYQQKIQTFLEARTLMILREEEVERHIRKDDATLYTFYEKNFSPRWRIVPRFFPSEKEAEEWKKSDAAKNRNQQAKSPHVHIMGRWYRPTTLPAEWKKPVAGMKPGELSAAIPAEKGFVVLDLLEHGVAERQDFESIRETVGEASYKAQKSELTARLLDQLMVKFHVSIDKELLSAIDLAGDNAAMADKVLVKNDKTNLTVSDFVAITKKNAPPGQARESSKEEAIARREQMVKNILAHNLVNWEALDRHYEERPPFSENFRFYKGHRLIRELENTVLRPQLKIEKEAVEKYYRENAGSYQGPVQVTYATVEGNAETIREIWAGVMQGKSFHTSVKAVTGGEPASKAETLAAIAPALAGEIAKLAPGETSKPGKTEQGMTRLVHLVDRRQKAAKTIDEAREDIRQKLIDQGLDEARDRLLADLKKKTSIRTEPATWRKIQQHYTGK